MSDDRAIPQPRPAAPGPAEPGPAGLCRARSQQLAVRRLLRGVSPALILVIVIAAMSDHPGPGTGGRGLLVLAAMAAMASGFVVGIWGIARRSGRPVAIGGSSWPSAPAR